MLGGDGLEKFLTLLPSLVVRICNGREDEGEGMLMSCNIMTQNLDQTITCASNSAPFCP